MGSPREIRLEHPGSSSGIVVEFTRRSQRLCVYGWYDNCVGIESTTISLADFLTDLGITAAMCEKALKGAE